MRIATLCLVLAGCLPDYRGIQVSDDVLALPNQYQATMVTLSHVVDEYDLIVEWYQPTIYWSDSYCESDPDNYAINWHGRCLSGVMFSCDELYVALSNADSTRICGSALAHEYGHCARLLLGWHPDGAHEDRQYWQAIERSQDEICGRGW